MISGIVTGVLLAAFLGIAVWAWAGRNRDRWEAAAQLPLRDEAARSGACCCGGNARCSDEPEVRP